MKNKFFKKAIWAVAALGVVVAVYYYQGFLARGVGNSWLQTDWSGGADTTATATHATDQEGWTKYYSKDESVSTDTPGMLTLASTTVTWTETETADFDAGSQTGVYASSGTVFLQKPSGLACSADKECSSTLCNNGYCDDCDYFTYDSVTYATVIIGSQCWMAQNLNVGVYATSINTGSSHSDVSNNGIIEKYCYNNIESNCDTYGGLYDWDEMMGYVTTAGTQGICPSGWHIPTDGEWYTLENYLKDEGQTCSASRTTWDCDTAGTKLKSGGTSGFGGLLAGERSHTGSFFNLSSVATFWSSSESGSSARRRYLISSESRVYRNTNIKTGGFSVRCLKD